MNGECPGVDTGSFTELDVGSDESEGCFPSVLEERGGCAVLKPQSAY